MIDKKIKNDQEPTIEEPKKVTPLAKEPDVVDVDLGFVEKRKFRINGDYNRMLELNVSDLNVFARFNEAYPKLQKFLSEAQKKVLDIPEDGESDKLETIANALTYIDKEMRKLIDYIFDTNASEVCAPSGNMFDPVGGQYRFERIIGTLSTLYRNGLDSEFAKMKNKVEKKTSKYTKGKK